ELHVKAAIALRIECSLIKPPHVRHILAMDSREGVLDARLADAGDAEHAGKFGGVARDPRLWIDRKRSDTCGLDRQPEPLLVLSRMAAVAWLRIATSVLSTRLGSAAPMMDIVTSNHDAF